MSTTQRKDDNKRLRVETEKTGTGEMRSDPFIGLEVGGRVFYCYRSTLTNTPGTLATRFGGDFSPGGHQRVDEWGRAVYSIDRDPKLFEYILAYLRMPTKLPPLLVKFGSNPELWRALREEADYFGLGHLAELLKVTYSCSPDLGKRGVLYWLGTGKGKHEYKNPFTLGAVHVGGWMDKSPEDLDNAVFYAKYWIAQLPESRASFVEYRPKLVTNQQGFVIPGSPVLPCRFMATGEAVVVDLREVLLKPSHFSLRFASGLTSMGCRGDWNFEGSVDGHTWDVLYEIRYDTSPLAIPQGDGEVVRCNGTLSIEDLRNEISSEIHDEIDVLDAVTSILEQHYRGLWELSTSKFYRYFRIIGKDQVQRKCLHCSGLELFGDICET